MLAKSQGDPHAPCPTYPNSKNDWGDGALREKASSVVGAQVAIVFVHGWQTDVVDCNGFKAASNPPAEIHFQNLAVTLAKAYPSYRLYAFTYPTFNPIDSGGFSLARSLAPHLGDGKKISRVIFIGHSMGGLVARVAANDLQTRHGQSASAIAAVITLGSPHMGIRYLGELYVKYKDTPGARDLIAALPEEREGESRLFTFAGNLGLSCGSYTERRFYVGCMTRAVPTDGVVDVSDALPPFAFRARQPYDGYDHTEMRAGSDLAGGIGDPLYDDIIEDISIAIRTVEPTDLVATAISSTRIDLSWRDNSDGENGFVLERAPSGSTSFSGIALVDPNTTSFSNTGLTSGLSYDYRVRSVYSGTLSRYSNLATATTPTVIANVPGSTVNAGYFGGARQGICIMSKYLASAAPQGVQNWTLRITKGAPYTSGTPLYERSDENLLSCEYLNAIVEPEIFAHSLTAGDQVFLTVTDVNNQSVAASWTWDGTNATPNNPAPETVIASLGGYFMGDFTRNGSDIFFFAAQQHNGCLRQYLSKVSVSGGPVTLLVPDVVCPSRVLTDGSYVYWTDGEQGYGIPGSIRRVSASGGAVETLATGLQGTSATGVFQPFVLNEGYLYFLSRDPADPSDRVRIRRISTSGGEVQDVVTTSAYAAFAVDGGYVYYEEDDSFNGCSGSLGSLRKIAKDGTGTPVTLSIGIRFQCGGNQIVVSSGVVYVAHGASLDQISSVSASGGTPTLLASDLMSPTSLNLDASYLYFSNYSGGGDVSRIDLGTLVKTKLSWWRPASGAALNATDVFWGSTFGVRDNCCGGAPWATLVRKTK